MKSKLAKISSTAVATVATFATSISVTFAKTALEWVTGISGAAGVAGTGLEGWIFKLLSWIIGFAAVAAVVMLIASGFLYITANGDENKIGKATKTLTFAIVGLVICFIAVMIVEFVLKSIIGGQ